MIDASQLEHFRERQLASLGDTCRRLAYSVTFNDYNEPVEAWTEIVIDLPCGIDMQAGNESDRTTDTVTMYDSTIRLPISDIWDDRDRIRVTKRFGEAVEPIDYYIASPIQLGPSGIRMLLSYVTV